MVKGELEEIQHFTYLKRPLLSVVACRYIPACLFT
jgi:hypothetical protein